MTFNEAEIRREADGKFGEKLGSAADITLDNTIDTSELDWGDSISTNPDGIDPDALGEIIITRVDDDVLTVATRRELDNDDPHFIGFLTDEYQAQPDTVAGVTTLDSAYFEAAIPEDGALTRADLRLALADGEPGRYDRDKADGTLDKKYRKYLLEHTNSPAEKEIAGHSEIHWKGTDSTTPDGTYLVIALEGDHSDGILSTYLMDEKERTILGRTETKVKNGVHTGSELYAGGGVKGGYWMRATDEDNRGTIAFNERIMEQKEALVQDTIDDWKRKAGPDGSALEHAIQKENGINVVLRNKLRLAYESDNGRIEVPRLLRENYRLVTPGVHSALLRLSEDPTQ